MPPIGSIVTAENVVAGAQVSRSRSWCWGDQDGGQPMTLVRLLYVNDDAAGEGAHSGLCSLIGSLAPNSSDDAAGLLDHLGLGIGDNKNSEENSAKKTALWVEVQIPGRSNETGKLRIGAQQAWDLVYGPTPEPQDQPVMPPNDLLGQPVTLDNFIPNARVSRNTDWRWGDQDKEGPGILLRKDDSTNGWAFARFGAATDNSYRIGDEHGGHDLVYGDQPKDLVPIDVEWERLIGQVVTAENFRQGARVCRGAKWVHGRQDLGGKPGLLLRLQSKAIWVRWSDGSENRYLAGFGDIVYGTEPKQPVAAPVFSGKFSLVADCCQGMDAQPSGAVVARDSRDMSCYTEQVFNIETAEFDAVFDVSDLHWGFAGLGIMKDGITLEACTRRLVGEAELESSVGVALERGWAFIVTDGKAMDEQTANAIGSTLLCMKIRKGTIKFSIKDEPFESTPASSPYLSGLTGMFRVVVSFNTAEQQGFFYTNCRGERCPPLNSLPHHKGNVNDDDDADGDSDDDEAKLLRRRNKKPVVRPESEFPHLEWTPGAKFTFFDSVRNVDVIGNDQRELKCITSTRCTLFSNEVFDIETADFKETVYFPGGILGGDVCFGIVGENPTLHAAMCICGERELRSSIGLFLRRESASVLYKNKLWDEQNWQTKRDIAVTIRVKNRNLTFDVDGRSFSSEFLNRLNKKSTESTSSCRFFVIDVAANDDHLLLRGKFRLAISLSYPGQVATFDRERGRGRNVAFDTLSQNNQPTPLHKDAAVLCLRDASTCGELKAALDVLPRSESVCFTGEVRELILQKQNLIVDAACANAVASLFAPWTANRSKCDLLRTGEIHDLIIHVLAPKISGGDPVDNLVMMIRNIVQKRFAREMYTHRQSFSAILDCFLRTTAATTITSNLQAGAAGSGANNNKILSLTCGQY